MPKSFDLFIFLTCVLSTFNVRGGPIPRTSNLLPLDVSRNFPREPTFGCPGETPCSKIDISSPNFTGSDAVTMKFNDHPLSESAVEHRDPIFVARAAIDSSTDNSMPTSKHASIRDPRSELQEHIKSLEVMLFSTKLPYVQHEMEITYNFLSSLGAQYVTQKRNVWVQLVIPKARNIREVSANGGSTYPQAIKDAAKTLLDFYDNVDTMESTTLTSDEVASKVDTFRETLLSNSLAAQAALVSLDGSIAEMFTAKAQLWKLSTSDMRPGDLNYSQLRNTAARIELGAQRHAEDKIFPKSSVAAKAYLQLVAETDKKLLWKVDPKKRKAETDIDTAPYKYYLIASRFP